MITSRRMDRHGLVTTNVSGTVSTAEYLDSLIELGELTDYSNELWEIVLLDASTRIVPGRRATMELAHGGKELIQFKSRGAISLCIGHERQRTWANQMAVLLRGDAVPVVVFSDECDARHWLRLRMQYSRRDATTRIMRRPHGTSASL